MKKLYIILFSFLPFCVLNGMADTGTPATNSDKELAWVDEQIQAILPSRIGIPEGFINSLKDPMKMKTSLPSGINGAKLLPPPKLGGNLPLVVEEPLRLQAVINKSVLINGKWYKLNDSVRNYTLSEIKNNSVLLIGKKAQKLILFLTKQNTNIKITTK
ncbi:hypothetical protein [Sulfuricurvum sp.]|uniref:hypothetical protein n=1 Tax=Sulfuricurvum sp. TaxID=2025608 RepID=UPI00261E02D3|nr:hypothetical protein [Sulfuricurvum sp.]MDD3597270.1 hypothetical protein [Sulfuricurvum sp.]